MSKNITGSKNIYENRIKEATKNAGASSRLLSLWVDVDYTTVSSWNSNTYQPNADNLYQISQLLEEDYRNLIKSQEVVNTGFAKAMEIELQRLHKEENMPYEIEAYSKSKKKKVMINNPEMRKALLMFAKKFKDSAT